MNLYSIDSAIMECVDADTGEILDTERLDGLKMEREKKIENIGLWIISELAYASELQTEIERLNARKEAANKKAESLKQYLNCFLSGSKFHTARLSVSYRRSEAVEILDQEKLPGEYLKEKVTFSVDKAAIKKQIKSGNDVPGAVLVEKQNIQIK